MRTFQMTLFYIHITHTRKHIHTLSLSRFEMSQQEKVVTKLENKAITLLFFLRKKQAFISLP